MSFPANVYKTGGNCTFVELKLKYAHYYLHCDGKIEKEKSRINSEKIKKTCSGKMFKKYTVVKKLQNKVLFYKKL